PPTQRRSLLQKCPGPFTTLPSSHSSRKVPPLSEMPSPQNGIWHEHRHAAFGLLLLPLVTAFEQTPLTPPTMQSAFEQHGWDGGTVALGPLTHTEVPASHSPAAIFVAPSPQVLG